MVIKTGAYRISVYNKTLIYLDSIYKEDISESVANFGPFKELDIDFEKDTVYLTDSCIGYVFLKSQYSITKSLSSGNCVLADRVFYADTVLNDQVEEENKMEEKRYEIYSGNNKIASDMTVEIAMCFVEAYLKKYGSRTGLGVAICPMEKIESA